MALGIDPERRAIGEREDGRDGPAVLDRIPKCRVAVAVGFRPAALAVLDPSLVDIRRPQCNFMVEHQRLAIADDVDAGQLGHGIDMRTHVGQEVVADLGKEQAVEFRRHFRWPGRPVHIGYEKPHLGHKKECRQSPHLHECYSLQHTQAATIAKTT